MTLARQTWEPPISNSDLVPSVGLLLWPVHLAWRFRRFLYLITAHHLSLSPSRPGSLSRGRIALGVLVFFIALRSLALRERLPFAGGLTFANCWVWPP